MRTIVSKGPQTELEVIDVAPLTAGAGQVVVDARAIGVGRVDLIMRQVMPMDFVPGIEVAGIVAAVGLGGDRGWIGRRVFARVQAGGYAEQVVVGSAVLVALPDEVTFEAAVASGINALVAHFCLAKAQVAAGETALVRGIRGGIGHLASQMAANIGAKVIESAREGAPLPADVVIDLVAGPDTGAYIEQLNANGRYVIAGISAGMPPADFASALLADFRKSRAIVTLSLDTISDADINSAADRVLANVAAGKLAPILKLEQASQAHQLIAKGGLHGKIVLVP